MKEVTVQELKEMLDKKADFQFVDVRETLEYEIANIGAELIPLSVLPDRVGEISRDKQVVIHCKSGGRSSNVVRWLESQGYDNVYNLKGGILAYASEIDTSLTKY
jgi:rhodanese-related sulfurtransferase